MNDEVIALGGILMVNLEWMDPVSKLSTAFVAVVLGTIKLIKFIQEQKDRKEKRRNKEE